ncbi:MAG: cell division protein ZapB [Desulfobacterales bacterium]|nr:cell division protein ZapB [Desulfobacterales bacterium]
MGEENFPGQFKNLEDKIEGLVQTYRDLHQTKSGLEARVSDLEGVLKEKVVAEEQYSEEKSVVREKIEDLLSRLDQVLGSK